MLSNLQKIFQNSNYTEEKKRALKVSKEHARTLKQVKESYRQQPSLANYLPWMEYDPISRCFLLEDGYSVAIGFELEDVACEARSTDFLIGLRDKFQRLFQDTIPQEQDAPWILQFYLEDETSLMHYPSKLADYAKPGARNTQLTEEYLKVYETHCQYMTRTGGLFTDNEVSGQIFQGKKRRIRLMIYRRLNESITVRRGRTIIQDANAVAKNVFNQLLSCGVLVKRMDGKSFYEWMVRWFNPASVYGEGNTDQLLKKHPYPGDNEMPFGYDFAEQIFFSVPESDEKKGVWLFDGWPHKFITVQGLSAIPTIGHLTAEIEHTKNWYALFDKFPEGSVFCMTVVIEDQNNVREHIKVIEKSAVGEEAEAQLSRVDCQRAYFEVEQGNYLYPTIMGVYLRAPNTQQLIDREIDAEIILNNNGFKPIRGDVDLTPLDAYLRYLPMCYDARFDRKYTHRSRYVYARQIANLLPLYGRYRGTGNPGLSRFNRGGEPFYFDPFSRNDKSFNSHCLYFGSTGSGKSSALVADLLQVMAVYRPRLFIIEAGNSFGLLADYFAKQGLSVNKVQLKRANPVALNPFADGLRLMEQINQLPAQVLLHKLEQEEDELEKTLSTLTQAAGTTDLSDEEDERDILGEMALAAQLMITGGEVREEEKITRQDRLLILNALMKAAKIAQDENATQMLAEHVVRALRQMAETIDASQSASAVMQATRLREMANGMDYFCVDDLSARFFNRSGHSWPDVDVTVLDMGIMAGKGYETQLALAVMGILNRVASIAETNQYDERMVLLVTDESHILTKNPLTAAQYTKYSKMSRKLGWWLWFATQNMGDFPEEARKMLSMIEFWIVMATSEDEIREIKRFKNISDEQHRMLLSIRKEMGKYTEGVVLSPKVTGLFRNVPPRLAFALAQTEKDEKSRRAQLMQQLGITEIEAAEKIAQDLMQLTWNEGVV